MSIVKMNVPCKVFRKEANNIYGEQRLSEGRNTKCAVIKFFVGKMDSTVRTDSGGTRGHADEKVSQTELLFNANENLKIDDIVELRGQRLIVHGIYYQHKVSGKIDHIKAVLEIE